MLDRSASDQAVRRVEVKQRAQKRVWDRRNKFREPDFAVGDWVRYQLMPRPRKGRIQFSDRRRIVERTGPASYRLDDGTKVHAERLSRWTAAGPTLWAEDGSEDDAASPSVDRDDYDDSTTGATDGAAAHH